MAKARIVLRGCLSFTTPRGKKWLRGKSEIIAKQSDITYYQRHSEFNVTLLGEPKLKPVPVEPVEPEPDAPPAHTQTSLGRLTKDELKDVGLDFELELDDSTRKDDMILAILKAQG